MSRLRAYSLTALMLLISSTPFVFDPFDPISAKSRWFIRGALVIGLCILIGFRREVASYLTGRGGLIALVLLGSAFLSGIWATNRWLVLERLEFLVAMGIAALGGALISREEGLRRRFLRLVFYSGGLAAGIAMLQILGVPLGGRVGLPPTAMFGNQNYLAEYLGMTAFAGMALGSLVSVRERLMLIPGVLIMVGVLALTLARGASLAFLAAAACGAILAWRAVKECRAWLAGSVGVLLLVLAAGFWLGPLRAQGEAKAGLGDANVLSRLAVWRDTLRISRDHWLIGTGSGNFEIQYPRYRTLPEELVPPGKVLRWAHNDYLQLAAEEGIVGVAAWGVLLGTVLAARRPESADQIFLLSAIIFLLGNNLFAFGFQQVVPSGLFFAFAGILAGRAISPRPASGRLLLLPIVPLLLLLAMGGNTVRVMMGESAWNEARRAWRERDLFGSRRSALEAIRWIPEHREGHLFLARLAQELGWWDEARRHLADLLRLEPFSYSVKNELGEIADRMGEPGEAERKFQEAIRIFPGSSASYLALGNLQFRLGKVEEARQALETAIRLNPSLPEAYNNLGVILELKREFPAALALYKRALAAGAGNGLLYYNLSNLYGKTGQPHLALHCIERAYRLTPHDERILSRLLFLQGAARGEARNGTHSRDRHAGGGHP